jgi:MFS family permease
MVTTGARRWLALLAVAMSLLVVGLDLTVLNLALPSIANALHASTSDLQWFSDSYSLVLGVTVARRIGSAALLASVRSAFVDGLDVMLWTCGGIALASALLALAFLPRRTRGGAAEQQQPVPAGSGETSSERAELGI